MTPEQIAALPGDAERLAALHDGRVMSLGDFVRGPYEMPAAKHTETARLLRDLAASVIEQQRIITALSEDASKAAELAAENERLRAALDWYAGKPSFIMDNHAVLNGGKPHG